MIREAEIEGEACSTCRHSELHVDRYEMPWHSCAKRNGEVIARPDDLVCDRFEHIP